MKSQVQVSFLLPSAQVLGRTLGKLRAQRIQSAPTHLQVQDTEEEKRIRQDERTKKMREIREMGQRCAKKRENREEREKREEK